MYLVFLLTIPVFPSNTLLQTDLDTVNWWAMENYMKLHERKFELTINRVSWNLLIHELPFVIDQWFFSIIDDIEISPAKALKDLCGFFLFLDKERSFQWKICTRLVRSNFEYCCPLWHSCMVRDIQKLMDVQRHFTRRISVVVHLNQGFPTFFLLVAPLMLTLTSVAPMYI